MPGHLATSDLAELPVNLWFVGQQASSQQRAWRYVPASVAHPGKMLPELARRILGEYTGPGAWVLDPMSGIGTTGVEAIHLGRNYIGVELEPQFIAWQRANLELATSQGATGKYAVQRGDARRLAQGNRGAAPVAPAYVDAVVTSPPYGARLRSVRTPSPVLQRLIAAKRFGGGVLPRTYGTDPANLGNRSDRQYLREMASVYRGCYDVLRPGGYLVTVVRPNRERYHLRPIHHETVHLCRLAGFDFLDEIIAVIGRVELPTPQPPRVIARSSFFKRLAVLHLRQAGHPISLEQLEYVLVFRKPGALAGSPRRSRSKNDLSVALADPHLARRESSGETRFGCGTYAHPTLTGPAAPAAWPL